MLDLWYKDAIIYCLDVETFQDANGDGIGDFRGLTGRLDYISGLGATCLWLLPFFPTPNRDNGYDITNYYGVDHRLGSLGDFVEFMHRARERGLRVIIDLPVNHTSNEHPWFEEACRDPESPLRDFYVWSEEKPETSEEDLVFPGVQESIWTYQKEAGAYYLHRFYEHQPDLNIANLAVREEICKIMGFWLELGVSGFRMDAAPFLIELKGLEDQADVDDPYEYLREFREYLSWRRGDAILLAEANVAPDKLDEYFGDGTKMHMLFNFILNQHLFLALARQEAEPLKQGLRLPPQPPPSGQWANFIRNHDELNLASLSDAEREEVFAVFAPDPGMRLYERGIRRRLPPMLDGNEHRIRLAYSLMFSLPGTPVVRYGEEIGMGEDLSLEERDSVRTPMQWSDEPNGGFSIAARDEIVRPVIEEGPFGAAHVNVGEERRNADSLLNWMERIIRLRRECREFGWGQWEVIETGARAVFAHGCTWRGGTVIVVHNLSPEPQTVALDVSDHRGKHLVDLLGDRRYHRIDGDDFHVELDRYGFRWFRLAADEQHPTSLLGWREMMHPPRS